MDISRDFIVIKDEYKSNIESIRLNDKGVYEIKYKGDGRVFPYKYNDVVWLRWKDAIKHNPSLIKAYRQSRELTNIIDIYSFNQGEKTHWRIKFSDGSERNYMHGDLQIQETCLSDDIAKNAFEYLKQIAHANNLGKEDNVEEKGILGKQYDKIDFIDKSLAVAPYLDPAKYKIRNIRSSELIFPFGCNASQEKAVTAAFENQISVIQGPPGTGKTQTILNIIANILVLGKTVLVVSNNNSATENVKEKLQKYGFGFIVAPLGKKENKESFINNQIAIPAEVQSWQIPLIEAQRTKSEVASVLSKLRNVFSLQEELALLKQEKKAVDLEWNHFSEDNEIDLSAYKPKKGVKASRYMKLWLHYQAYVENDIIAPHGFFGKLEERLKWTWINFVRSFLLGIRSSFNPNNIRPIILELQALYYLVRQEEIENRIKEIEGDLKVLDGTSLGDELCSKSTKILKNALFSKYHIGGRHVFDNDDLWKNVEEVSKQYPVVLSTTFSARTSLPDFTYDYIIMDEASQVSIDTGALALTCAKNAVIVGDTMQLPNVVTDEAIPDLVGIFKEFKLADGYNCAENSFLQSICSILPNVKQTLLREHYRCHPTIINFCNQRFYGGELVIMTEDHGEDNVMIAKTTTPGEYVRKCYVSSTGKEGKFNNREIEVVRDELLQDLSADADIGIITPYNGQVEHFSDAIPIEVATIHKYQGREKDIIIMSTVDDQITEFCDNSNLINVAISRAKYKFLLVTSGNEQERKGNIYELLEYIAYNRMSVTESKIFSIFDYLYSHYTKERQEFLAVHKKISEFDSENLTFALLENILAEHSEYNHLGIICHMPIRNVIRDWSLLDDDEKEYIRHYSTHFDFLIINHVTKKPILAIETDGYSYHHEETEQHSRDKKKDHILEMYRLPLLRLSTIGSREEEKIIKALNEIVCLKDCQA